jgi:hypothetical protein
MIALVKSTLGHDELLLMTKSGDPWSERTFIVSGGDAAHVKNRLTLWEKLKHEAVQDSGKAVQFVDYARAALESVAMFLLMKSLPGEKPSSYKDKAKVVEDIAVFQNDLHGDKEC